MKPKAYTVDTTLRGLPCVRAPNGRAIAETSSALMARRIAAALNSQRNFEEARKTIHSVTATHQPGNQP